MGPVRRTTGKNGEGTETGLVSPVPAGTRTGEELRNGDGTPPGGAIGRPIEDSEPAAGSISTGGHAGRTTPGAADGGSSGSGGGVRGDGSGGSTPAADGTMGGSPTFCSETSGGNPAGRAGAVPDVPSVFGGGGAGTAAPGGPATAGTGGLTPGACNKGAKAGFPSDPAFSTLPPDGTGFRDCESTAAARPDFSGAGGASPGFGNRMSRRPDPPPDRPESPIATLRTRSTRCPAGNAGGSSANGAGPIRPINSGARTVLAQAGHGASVPAEANGTVSACWQCRH